MPSESPLAAQAPVFASTGPHGHRARMRQRLLDRGPAALADYEILEMLLFLSIERRDTKPLAKAAINRFGSLAAVLRAPGAELCALDASLGHMPRVLALVRSAAQRLAGAEARARPVLGDLLKLGDYLEAAPGREGLRALFLDARNRLLADEMPGEGQVLRRALGLHAASVILAGGGGSAAKLEQARRQAAKVAVQVHDWVVCDADGWISLGTGRPF